MLPAAIAALFGLAVVFSALGLGGAMLYVPVLKWLGFDFKTVAIPTALLLNGLTTLSAAAAYGRAGLVDWRGGLPMAVACLLAAPLGALGTHRLPTETLVLLFALVMAAVGVRMLVTAGRAEPQALLPAGRRALLTGIAGLLVGALSGLLGLGGGSLILAVLLALGYPTKQAAATAAFIAILPSFSGFAGHVAAGSFPGPLLAGGGLAVVLGSQAGARLMRRRLNARWMKRAFGVLLMGVAAQLAWPVLAG